MNLIKCLKAVKPLYKFTSEVGRRDTFYYNKFWDDLAPCLLNTPTDVINSYEFIYLPQENSHELDVKFLLKNKTPLEKAYSLVSDKELFVRYLLRVVSSDLRYYILPVSSFPLYHHPLFKKSYSTLVDCGPFNMDNINTFNACDIFAFEPNKYQYDQLCGIKKSTVAVSDRKGRALFYMNGQASSLVRSSNSISTVFTNTLDNIFRYVKVDFIKMDIEGAELQALDGAKGILKRDKPDLAISLYHNKEDFFNIPLLIHKINPNYELYLGNHSLKNVDFVLYAV